MPQVANRDHCRINYPRLLEGLKTVEKECLPLLPIELKDQYEELRQTQKILKNDLAFNAAARLVRLLHVRYTQFLEDLETGRQNGKINMDVSISSSFEHSPLMIPSKTLGKVYVFPNLVLDKVNISDLRNICWVVCFDSLKTFNEVRLNKQNSWQPFSRAWQKIKRYEEISLVRALVRYTNIKTQLNHSQIDALAASYIELTKPLELIYAEKPEDYIKMFCNGGVNTCMTTTSEKAKSWSEILKHKHHPMSLFAYHPDVKGVYCIKDTQIVARTLLYQTKPGIWQYGCLKTINSFYNTKFVKLLKDTGHTQLDQRFSKKVTIKVPGLYSAQCKEYLLPVPYMDNVSEYLCGQFNYEEKQFTLTFNCPKADINISTHSTGGFVKVTQLNKTRCPICNKLCKEIHTPWEGRETFCSSNCARDGGYVYATTAQGESQLRLSRTCYFDFFDSSHAFTNRNSCMRHGGMPVIHEVTLQNNKIVSIVTEPKELSIVGVRVRYQDRQYHILPNQYDVLVGNSLITSTGKLVCDEMGAV